MEIWSKLGSMFAPPKAFWSAEEHAADPGFTDRLMYYLITYYDSQTVARKAVRWFLGIDGNSFCGWDEVRVATLRDLDDALKSVGGSVNTWELAVTIKDFLQNTFDTIDTVNLDVALDDLKPSEIVAYLRQLRGHPEAWKKGESSPYRPYTSIFQKHCLKYRKENEAVLPENVIHYLEYMMGRTSTSPFEFYANRLLVRLGIFEEQERLSNKVAKYNSLIGEERPINKHRQIVQFSKTICISKPRCNVCPLAATCQYPKLQEASKINLADIQFTGTTLSDPTVILEPVQTETSTVITSEILPEQTTVAAEIEKDEIEENKPKLTIAKRKLPSTDV